MSERKKLTIASFRGHAQAEAAIVALRKAGFDISKVSIVGKNYQTEEHVVDSYTMSERIKAWGKIGGFWVLVIGAGFFLLPTTGSIGFGFLPVYMLAGAVVVGGFSLLATYLYSICSKDHRALKYQTELKAKKYLLVANDSESSLEPAKRILSASGIAQINLQNEIKKQNRYSTKEKEIPHEWRRPF